MSGDEKLTVKMYDNVKAAQDQLDLDRNFRPNHFHYRVSVEKAVCWAVMGNELKDVEGKASLGPLGDDENIHIIISSPVALLDSNE